MQATVLAEIDEEGRVIHLTLKDQVMGLPDSIWEALVEEMRDEPTPGCTYVECEIEIPTPGPAR